MNILIIDSNTKNKRLIETAFKELLIDCKIHQISESAELALNYLSSHSIDLVLFQTELEDLPGYVFFKKIRDTFPSKEIIMITTTQYADYVQKALQEGLTDFLYKPLRKKEITRALRNAYKLYEEKNKKILKEKKQKKELNHQILVFQDRFLINLIHGQYEKELDIVDGFQYFNLPLSPNYCILIMKIDDFKKISLALEEEERELMLLTLLSITQSIVNSTSVSAVPFMNRQDSVTLIVSTQNTKKNIILFGKKLREEIRTQANFTITIGIGRIVKKTTDIHVSYKQAKASLRHRFYLGNNSVIHIDFVEPNNQISYDYPLKKEELLVFEIVNGNEKKALDLLDSLFESLINKSLPHGLLPKIILDILVSVNRTASAQGIEMEKLYSEHVLVKEIREKESLHDAHAYSKQIISKICSFVENIRFHKEKILLQEAKKYVESFYNNPLSLQDTALLLQTTPKYLNLIFIQELGTSFSRYVEQVRIQHGKKLLLTNDTLDSIASQIGFQNTKYFSSLFEQIEGVSPNEYRKLQKYENRIIIPPLQR